MADMIKLRELPGIAELEAALHVPGRHLLKEYDDLEERIDKLSRELFGLSPDETFLLIQDKDWRVRETPTRMGELTDAAAERIRDWELHFEFLDYEYDEEAETFWTAMGWDVTDGEGNELAIIDYLGRPLVCVVKRLHSKARFRLDPNAPEATAADLTQEAEEWGARLAEEARRFKPRR